jgi:CelD/BcsL family acetyltransferase involved in cellulose biosynthesis
MITIEEINRFDQALGLKDQWNKLVDEAGLDVSLSFDFVMSLWEAYFEKRDLILLLAREENELTGIFPLYISKENIFGTITLNKIGLLTNSFFLYNDFIIKKGAQKSFDAVLHYLDAHYNNWDIFEITGFFVGVKNDSNAMRWLSQNRYKRFIKRKVSESLYVELDRSWEEYMHKKSHKSRYNLQIAGKKLEKDGRLEVKYFGKPQELDFIFDKVHEIESESWRINKGTKGGIISAKRRKLHESYFKKAAAQDKLLAVFLYIDGECAAFVLGIIGKKICHLLNVGYKEKFKKYSPGLIAFNHFIKKLFELGVKEFNIEIAEWPGVEHLEWKKRWATGAKENYWIWLYNGNRSYALCIYYLRRLSGFIKNIVFVGNLT